MQTPVTPPQPPTLHVSAAVRRRAIVAVPVAALIGLLVVIGGLSVSAPGRTAIGATSPPASPPTAATTPPATNTASPAPLRSTRPAGRNDVPSQPGTATQVLIVVDTSRVADDVAIGIRAALGDFVNQLPDYDVLTLITTDDTQHAVVDHATLAGPDRVAAIRTAEEIRFEGGRNLPAGVRAAAAAAAATGPGSYHVMLIATGADDTTAQDLEEAGRAPVDADGSSHVGIDLHAVAVGMGDHEHVLARAAHADYQWARRPDDLPLALAPYRLFVSEATLLAYGPVPPLTEAVAVRLGDHPFGVRFTVYSPGRSLRPTLTSPTGRLLDVSSRDDGVTVQELDDRTTIVIDHPDAGEWKLRFVADAAATSNTAGAWFEVEEVLSFVDPTRTAFGTGDTTGELRMGLALLHQDFGKVRRATARIDGPDGVENHVVLTEMTADDLLIGADSQLGAIVKQPAAGSYRVTLQLDATDVAGRPRTYLWLVGAHVLTIHDSDGDGITDAIEEHYGLDPRDPADGAADHDHDGLSTSSELMKYATHPDEWDTDDGGERDGSEVKAGRNPLDKRDDVRPRSCVELVPKASQKPVATSRPTTIPVPELEALLPDQILGRPTQKYSAAAPQELEYIFGLFDAFLACTNTTRADMRLASAAAADLGYWGVVAVEVDGVTGHEMEDIWLYRMGETVSNGEFEDRTVDGRTFHVTRIGSIYATGKTFYWILSLAFGDFPTSSAPPLPDSQAIVDDIVRQLPAR
jgi:hypothetical protein